MTERLHLRPRHRARLEALLREHLPDVEVWAYGSRVNGQSHDGSDLDLVLRGSGLEEIDICALGDFIQALHDSTIPFLVEARDWSRLPERFHQEIEREYVEVVVLSRDTDGCPETLYRPRFPRHWRRRSLYSLATWVNGIAFRDIQSTPAGMPVIKIAEIKGGITRQTKFTHQTFDESVRVGPGDLLFSWSGQPEESIDAFVWRGPEGWLNQHVFRVTTASCVDPTFFLFLLRYLRRHFVAIARNKQTTGLGHVTKQDLKELEVAVPPLREQRAIAHILGRLDDKIELNRRMNETLEAMARALFKSWFVDFDPVRAKMEGRGTGLTEDIANLFPDRLIDSEMGEIPEGWGVVPLDAVARFQNGLALQKFRPAPNEERLPVVKIAQLRAGEASSGEWASSSIKPGCIIEDGDVLFSWSGSLLVRIWCGGRAALNQHLFKVTSEEYPKWFYLQSLLSHLAEFRRIAQDKATTMGHIKRHHLTEALCAAPPDGVIERLSGTFSSLLERQVANELSSRTLVALRDALLPKLLSGEIRAPDAKRVLEAAT